jgi:uncharacterized cysteine cluster protein YcgN (CxxCxxCC family)
MEETEIKCNRCGRCCYWEDDDGKIRKCVNLIHLPSKKTVCRAWVHRVGKTIGFKGGCSDRPVTCNMRKDVPYRYPDCPYNVLHPNTPMKNWDILGKRKL